MDSNSIIECVKKYPVLYDPDTKKKSGRKQAWVEVGKELDQNVESVKRKWKNIRDEYVKFSRGKSKSKNYSLASEMAFLKPYLPELPPKVKKENKIIHEKTNLESDDENHSPTQSPASVESLVDSMNGLDLILLGASKLMKTYPQEPAEALSSFNEVDQTCLRISKLIMLYSQSKPRLVEPKIDEFLTEFCAGENNNDQSSHVTNNCS